MCFGIIVFNCPFPEDEAASGSQTVSPIADKKGDPEEKPLRSLVSLIVLFGLATVCQ